jgi:hypothetical protein
MDIFLRAFIQIKAEIMKVSLALVVSGIGVIVA